MVERQAVTVIAGAAVIGLLTVAGGAALYYAWLPTDAGPSNSSPPPEAFGLVVGALLGCCVGVAATTFVNRSAERVMQSFAVALGVGSLYWLILGSGDFVGRVGDCVFAAVVCSIGAGLGVAAGIGGSAILRSAAQRNTKTTEAQ